MIHDNQGRFFVLEHRNNFSLFLTKAFSSPRQGKNNLRIQQWLFLGT